MSELVFGRDAEVAAWVAARLPSAPTFSQGNCAAIGIARDGRLIAGAVYTEFRRMTYGNDICITLAADDAKWATRGVIRALLRYAFAQCECVRMTAIIGRKNKRSRKFCEGMGFKLEGMCAHAYDGRQDAAVYGLVRKGAAKWLDQSAQASRQVEPRAMSEMVA